MRYRELLETESGKVVYHGTTREKWAEDMGEHPEGLHVSNHTVLPEDYARSRWLKGETPIMVSFRLDDLKAAGLRFEPNPNFVATGRADTWEESLAEGAMVIRGFREEHKRLGTVTPLRFRKLR